MDNMQINGEKSRKKFLVPLVVLLLCGVSLVGAAYAYTSTLTYTDNTATIEYLSVDKDSSANALVVLNGNDIMGFTDNFTYKDVAANSVTTTEKVQNVIKYEYASSAVVATYYLYINDENDTEKNVNFTVSSDALDTSVLYTLPAVAPSTDGTSVKLADVFDVTYTVSYGDTPTEITKKVIIPSDATITGSESDYTASVPTETSLTVTITFTLKTGTTATGIVETVGDGSSAVPANSHDAAYWYGQFTDGDNKFDLIFKAVSS